MLFKKKAVESISMPELPALEPEILEAAQEETAAPESSTSEVSTENAGANPKDNAALEGRHMYEADLTTSISRNMVVEGSLTSKDNIEIFGRVDGPVTCEAVVKVHGEVYGDIRCITLVATGAVITGNITGENSVVIGENSRITGDIATGIASISGRVDGSLKIGEAASISANGCVHGDIKTPSIEVSKGAVIYGSVLMEKTEPPQELPAAVKITPEVTVEMIPEVSADPVEPVML